MSNEYVSRAALKLIAVLDRFHIDPAGLVCADLGCNVGGFTDVLLRRGATKVYAVDTGYGTFAWKLRNDGRVVVMERTNALHVDPPEDASLVVIDLGWTKQGRAIPASLRWNPQHIITLIKPHYEAGNPRLSESESQRIMQATLDAMGALGVQVVDHLRSPIVGSKGGNVEYLALLRRA